MKDSTKVMAAELRALEAEKQLLSEENEQLSKLLYSVLEGDAIDPTEAYSKMHTLGYIDQNYEWIEK